MTAREFTKLQKQLGLTDAELAAQLGVRRETVWTWRTGKAGIERTTELAMRYLMELHVYAVMERDFQGGSGGAVD